MTTEEAKKLVGTFVKYKGLCSDWKYGDILDVRGDNILVGEMGFTEWWWLPNVHIVPITP